MGVQYREGEPGIRRGRVAAWAGWRPRQGWQEAEAGFPDLDQCAASEDSGDRQTSLPEGGHRGRAQIGDRVGVLLLRRGEPRYVFEILCRYADVQYDDGSAGPRLLHAPVPLFRNRVQRQQMAGPQYHPLAQ